MSELTTRSLPRQGTGFLPVNSDQLHWLVFTSTLQVRLIMVEETSIEVLLSSDWIANQCGIAKPTVGRTIPRQVSLGFIRKVAGSTQ